MRIQLGSYFNIEDVIMSLLLLLKFSKTQLKGTGKGCFVGVMPKSFSPFRIQLTIFKITNYLALTWLFLSKSFRSKTLFGNNYGYSSCIFFRLIIFIETKALPIHKFYHHKRYDKYLWNFYRGTLPCLVWLSGYASSGH